MNMEGVEQRPVSRTLAPMSVMALDVQAVRRSAEIRESWPRVMTSLSAGFCTLPESQTTKPLAMRSTTGSVRSTGAPGTPSAAVPRMSLPDLNLLHSLLSITVLLVRNSPPEGGREEGVFAFPVVPFYYKENPGKFQPFLTKKGFVSFGAPDLS